MIAMMISLFPTAVFGATGQTSQQQIDGEGSPMYYAIDKDGNITGEGQSSPVVKPEGEGSDRVVMSKSIKGTENENEFDITLSVSTTEDLENLAISPDAAVVLVMDVSNSMEWYMDGRKILNPLTWKYEEEIAPPEEQRIRKAKDAATKFVNEYVKEAGNAKRMISVVQYGANAQCVQEWTNVAEGNNKEAVLATIKNNVKIGFSYKVGNYWQSWWEEDAGGTNIEGGLMLANNLLTQLKATNEYKDIENLHVILLTDGVPTYHVSDNDKSNSTTFIEGTKGGGSSAKWEDYKDIGAAENGDKLASEIKGANNSRATLSTIAFSTDINKPVGTKNERTHYDNAAAWLKSFASQGCDYSADNTEGLLAAFEGINNTIKKLAEAWLVTDPLGDRIQYVSGVSADPSDMLNYDKETNTINWNLKKDPTVKKEEKDNKTTYTYTANYTVRWIIKMLFIL